MAVPIHSRGSQPIRTARVYEFFESRVLAHYWFIVLADGDEVQMMAPTFRSEKAARIFQRCVLEHPATYLLTIDGQLELARRIEQRVAAGSGNDVPAESLLGGLAYEKPPGNR